MTVLGVEAERVEQPEQMQTELMRLLAATEKVGANREADVRIVDVETDQLRQKEVDLMFIELEQLVADVLEHSGLLRFVEVHNGERRIEQLGFEQAKQPGTVRCGLDLVHILDLDGLAIVLFRADLVAGALATIRGGRRRFVVVRIVRMVLIVDGDNRVRFGQRACGGTH